MDPQKKKKPIVLFVSLSLLFHLLFLLLVTTVMRREKAAKTEPQAVWIQLPKTRELPQRIADIPKPAEEKIPEKASAQSLYDQSVPEETVATGFPAKKSPPPTPPQEREEKKAALKAEQDQKLLALKGTKPLPEKIPGMPELESEAGTAADDYFPDYKVGNRTYLNTDANPNIRYFVELKHKFRLTFNPVPSLRGQINEVARGKIAVVVGVSVNSRGELANLVIIRNSGVETYDREGLRTVRASAPFSSPPPNMLDDDGLLHMAWTFVVYL